MAAAHGLGRVLRLGAKGPTPGERGLPKPEVREVWLRPAGVDGDYNVYRQTVKHGDPDMAVLLLPSEILADLAREGWPVRPGDLGENITTAGIPYDRLAPPCRLRVGTATLRTTAPCTPCDNLFALPYVGPVRGPEFVRTVLGRRGWFARVEVAGLVRQGDPLELLPPAEDRAPPATAGSQTDRHV